MFSCVTFSSNHVWSSYLMVMSWCHVQGCTAQVMGDKGFRGSSKGIAETNPAWPYSRWGLPLTEWIYLFIFKTLSLPWGWQSTGRRLRGRTRPGDALYYGPPRPPSSYALVMSLSSGCHVISSCQVTFFCHVMSYHYVMSLCHGMLL
jgi:hypothetical protein